jgi:hypothetical protein
VLSGGQAAAVLVAPLEDLLGMTDADADSR